jgi:hypothetical protein
MSRCALRVFAVRVFDWLKKSSFQHRATPCQMGAVVVSHVPPAEAGGAEVVGVAVGGHRTRRPPQKHPRRPWRPCLYHPLPPPPPCRSVRSTSCSSGHRAR